MEKIFSNFVINFTFTFVFWFILMGIIAFIIALIKKNKKYKTYIFRAFLISLVIATISNIKSVLNDIEKY